MVQHKAEKKNEIQLAKDCLAQQDKVITEKRLFFM